MTKEQLIDSLNGDLLNEYKHLLFYLRSSVLVQGLHRHELGEFLAEQASSEMGHVREFAKLIIGLGGVPHGPGSTYAYTGQEPNYPTLTDPQAILEYAVKMEDEVVSNYTERLKDAEAVGGVDGKYVELFLEEQILHSREDADDMREMIKRVHPHVGNERSE